MGILDSKQWGFLAWQHCLHYRRKSVRRHMIWKYTRHGWSDHPLACYAEKFFYKEYFLSAIYNYLLKTICNSKKLIEIARKMINNVISLQKIVKNGLNVLYKTICPNHQLSRSSSLQTEFVCVHFMVNFIISNRKKILSPLNVESRVYIIGWL